ncbi:MAG: hypothetical protein U0Q16_29660 [Bryobacteraceae bacterium]
MTKPAASSRASESVDRTLKLLYAKRAYIEGLIRSIEQYRRLDTRMTQVLKRVA